VSALVLAGLAGATSAYAEHHIGEIDFACHVNPLHECYYFGEQVGENTVTVNGGTLKCTTAKFTGASTETNGGTTQETAELIGGVWVGTGELDWVTHELTVHPEYGGCKAFGQNVTITTTGCNYITTLTSRTIGTERIECEAGKSIVLKGNTTGCTVTIGAQTPANNAIDASSEGTPKDVKFTETVGTEPLGSGKTGITYTSSGGACGASGENGTFRGTVTEKCFKESAHKTQAPCTEVETVEIGKEGGTGITK
jgi:hypothetical protein